MLPSGWYWNLDSTVCPFLISLDRSSRSTPEQLPCFLEPLNILIIANMFVPNSWFNLTSAWWQVTFLLAGGGDIISRKRGPEANATAFSETLQTNDNERSVESGRNDCKVRNGNSNVCVHGCTYHTTTNVLDRSSERQSEQLRADLMALYMIATPNTWLSNPLIYVWDEAYSSS